MENRVLLQGATIMSNYGLDSSSSRFRKRLIPETHRCLLRLEACREWFKFSTLRARNQPFGRCSYLFPSSLVTSKVEGIQAWIMLLNLSIAYKHKPRNSYGNMP